MDHLGGAPLSDGHVERGDTSSGRDEEPWPIASDSLAPAVGSRASAAARRYGRVADLPNAPAAHAPSLILPIDMCAGMRYRKP